ncbi:EscG/YscG/SsaH family type III secretion system needle protein co-chaperone [Rahnella sp. SAP-1]|uniref:EscG/YscG/SsaH family type III secretion system needle protein co-chaperone n=1 Tax=Rouxiella aceris TaxID=2703884 RepID=A0A848MJN0_9GAMM|nr:EscG/YscG/SsaH family type III secretion system needle protein co-chaperone [Rouxiella aceris]NMP26474.1 EscG/YscG/SsaH family type III secretion system needle protein co-chaperone [Rouxiella aceris]
MISLDASLRRLIVETGLVAVNHGFITQTQTILAALPHLSDNLQARTIIEATMLIGLGNNNAASVLLQGNVSSEAQLLRQLISQSAN